MTTPLDLVADNRKWLRLHEHNKYQAEAARRITALLDEVVRLRAELGRARMDRAVQADEAQRARDHLAGLDLLAKVTPCTCSAQRARAEKAEADRDRLAATVDRVRALADGWASTGEPATKERQAALHGAARRLRAAIEGADS